MAFDSMDPKIAAIMRKLETKEEVVEEEKPTEIINPPKKPTTLEEFLKIEQQQVVDWPYMHVIADETLLTVDTESIKIGNVDEIKEILREAAPINLKPLEKLDKTLESIEGRLHYYADQVLDYKMRKSRLKDNLFHAPPITFMTEAHQEDQELLENADTEQSITTGHDTDRSQATTITIGRPPKAKKKKQGLQEQIAELQVNTVEYCKFPGFRPGELTELPGQLETPMILHRVTKAQDFNPGFRRFWKKAFLSEASIAMMQDIFWWIFINKFDNSQTNKWAKEKLYDRIADSFNSLFLSVNPEIKDKFFTVFCDCLAQAIFAAYHEAFPESDETFNDRFKQDLCNLVNEWISGIKPPPETYKAWNTRRLEPKFKGFVKTEQDKTKKIIQVAALNKELKNNLDIEEFEQSVRRMGDTGAASRLGTAPGEPLASREMTALSGLPVSGVAGINTVSQSRQAMCGTPRRRKRESHTSGAGPEFQRVVFNLSGRSPLLQHYLHMRQLHEMEQVGKNVTRTEIASKAVYAPTYRELIKESKTQATDWKKEYQRICEYTDHEVARLERKKREMYQQIEGLKKRINECTNRHEFQMMTDYINNGEYEKVLLTDKKPSDFERLSKIKVYNDDDEYSDDGDFEEPSSGHGDENSNVLKLY